MNNRKIDLYENSFSYFEVIKEFSESEFNDNIQMALKTMYNMLLAKYNGDEIMQMQMAAGLLENKLLKCSKEERKNILQNMMDTYIKAMLYNYINGDLDLSESFFQLMDDKIKQMVGFYGIFGENENLLNIAQNIRIHR